MKANRFRFRAWDKSFKRMKITGMGFCYGELNGEDVVIMQSTGLLDSKGVEVYEGDVVKHRVWYSYGLAFGNDEFKEDCISEVFWNQDLAQWSAREVGQSANIELVDLDKPEVIGNIYDAPQRDEAETHAGTRGEVVCAASGQGGEGKGVI